MKKITIVVLFLLILSGCNMQVVDTNWRFETIECTMPDGTATEFNIKSWKNFSDGDMLQFTTEDNVTYLTHSENCFLRSN